jgi:hypothetical protein
MLRQAFIPTTSHSHFPHGARSCVWQAIIRAPNTMDNPARGRGLDIGGDVGYVLFTHRPPGDTIPDLIKESF